MNDAGAKASIGKRAVHELKEFLIIAAYFLVCFTALAYLKAAILEAEGIVFAHFGFAAVKALICAKFLSIGYVFHLGERYSKQALIWPTLHRSFVFAHRADRAGGAGRRLLAPSHICRFPGRNRRRYAPSGDCDVDHIAADLDSLSLPSAPSPMSSADACCFVSSSNHAEGLTAQRRRHVAEELKTMRTVSGIVLWGLFVQAAHADEIRHLTFPDVMLGTWAETAEQCAAKDKSNVVIGPAKYGDGAGSCAVRWIVETPGLRGVNYAVHALCTSASLPEKTQIVDIVVRPLGQDRAAMGRSFEDLKNYQRCP